MMVLALSLSALGCKYPMETIYIEVPVETPIEPDDNPEIGGFTFTQTNPLRTTCG
jgi:hypothetical protein